MADKYGHDGQQLVPLMTLGLSLEIYPIYAAFFMWNIYFLSRAFVTVQLRSDPFTATFKL